MKIKDNKIITESKQEDAVAEAVIANDLLDQLRFMKGHSTFIRFGPTALNYLITLVERQTMTLTALYGDKNDSP